MLWHQCIKINRYKRVNRREHLLPLLFISFNSFEKLFSLLNCATTECWITEAAVNLVYELFFLTFVSQHGWPLDITSGKTPACLPSAAAARLLKAPASCVQKSAPVIASLVPCVRAQQRHHRPTVCRTGLVVTWESWICQQKSLKGLINSRLF